ncbi:hypothetical protein CK501_00340 [Halovibrio salipaludis]|uniref:FeS cluster biogenesis domain-containing protein n=1 Tax=Halovibrio salipaludis TaxID=2032626 RepID=A0A2A2FAC5_9GAMM|nr:CC/Se motif family (seleno)protein [Halovibrio salipaludis]PAU81637.1 hypothetical protein CK501_00340 [Halovibrio salipaludis]
MTGLDIEITPEARDWVARQGGSMMLRASTRHGCCGGSASVPVADLGEPEDPTGYVSETREGIRVHVADDLRIEHPLTVRLEGFLGFRRLFVDGVELAAG